MEPHNVCTLGIVESIEGSGAWNLLCLWITQYRQSSAFFDIDDFFLTGNSTLFPAGPGSPDVERRNCFRVNDTHHEGVETFTLTSDHMEHPRVTLQPNTTSITIINDDGKIRMDKWIASWLPHCKPHVSL